MFRTIDELKRQGRELMRSCQISSMEFERLFTSFERNPRLEECKQIAFSLDVFHKRSHQSTINHTVDNGSVLMSTIPKRQG